jgi:hypothetical protein
MASWYLIASLAKLRDEFNIIAPGRDKSSDGAVGDLAHQQNSSDHNPDETGNVPIRDADKDNEVHAIDVDVDLRVPGLPMEEVVQFLVARCRAGQEKRLRYIIFNRRIWSASNGWKQAPYSGANPHDHHAHFSGSYDSAAERSVASWHLEDIDMALSAEDKSWISAEIAKQVKAAAPTPAPTAKDVAEAFWNRTRTDKRSPWSDTARRAFLAELSKAVIAGTPIEPFPEAPTKE